MESRWRRTQLVSAAGSGGGYPGTTGDMAALASVRGSDSLVAKVLARISHQLTVEAHDRPAITALRLLAVLNVLSRSDAEGKSLLISVTPRYERAKPRPQKYASARRAARASYCQASHALRLATW